MVEIIPAHPMKEDAFQLWVFGESGERSVVLGLCRGGLLDACKVSFHLRECFLPDLRPKGRDTAGRLQRKEEVILVCGHSIQYGLHQRIIGIDQHVVGLKTIELERKVDDFKVGTAKQGMPTSKSALPNKACPKLNPTSETSEEISSSGRKARNPHCRPRSSTMPKAKQGISAAMNSLMNWRLTVSVDSTGCLRA